MRAGSVQASRIVRTGQSRVCRTCVVRGCGLQRAPGLSPGCHRVSAAGVEEKVKPAEQGAARGRSLNAILHEPPGFSSRPSGFRLAVRRALHRTPGPTTGRIPFGILSTLRYPDFTLPPGPTGPPTRTIRPMKAPLLVCLAVLLL